MAGLQGTQFPSVFRDRCASQRDSLMNKKKFVTVDLNSVPFSGPNFDSVCKVSCKNNTHDRLNALKFTKGNQIEYVVYCWLQLAYFN